jgi:hypothetical protein
MYAAWRLRNFTDRRPQGRGAKIGSVHYVGQHSNSAGYA